MERLKKAWQDIWFVLKLVLNDNWTTKTLRDNQQKSLELTCLVASVVCLVMTGINWFTGSFAMLISTAILCAAAFGLFLWMHYFNQSKVPRLVGVMVVLAIFSWYFLTGGEDGFSAIWILLIPAFFSMLLGFRNGFLCGVYFLVMIIAAFWTPLKVNFTSIYSETFITRFPVIYMGAFLLGIFMQTQLVRYEYVESTYQAELQKAVNEERKRVEQASLLTLATISSIVDAKDKYTQQHSKRVAVYSVEIARRMGWSKQQIVNLSYIALMHDVGKVGISDTILNKPGRLTEEEFSKIKEHPQIGAKILSNIKSIDCLDEGAHYHHERYDGSGYPEGLKGEEIPLVARIIGCADAVDAMRSKREYSSVMEMQWIRNEVAQCSSRQFDPYIADIMLQMIDDGFVQRISDDWLKLLHDVEIVSA